MHTTYSEHQKIVMSTYLYLNIHSTFLPAAKRKVCTQIPRYLYLQKKPPLHQKSDQNKTKKGENAEVGNYQIRYLNVPPNTCVPDDVHESGKGREEAYLLG